MTSAEGVKHDGGKLDMTLFPGWHAVAPIVEVLQWAVEKKGYPAHNWRHVEPKRYRRALSRHFFAWLDDPTGADDESGLSHLAHVGCCVMFLLWFGDQKSTT